MNVPEIPPSVTILQSIQWASDRLRPDPFYNARLDSELILAHVVRLDRLNLYLNFDLRLTSSEKHTFSDLVKRRIQGEPVQYLIGFTEFYGRSFIVSPAVLIPRPETEILIDYVKPFLERRLQKAPRDPAPQLDLFNVNPTQSVGPITVVDIGTGSGIIALTLASELPGLLYYASDVSSAALNVAEQNAEQLKLKGQITFLEGPFMVPLESKLEKSCDLILANPPYITRSDMAQLPDEIRGYEPRVALDGGEDGLECYAELVKNAPFFLNSGGMLAFEIGADQADAVTGLFTASQLFSNINVVKDYNHLDRVVSAMFTG